MLDTALVREARCKTTSTFGMCFKVLLFDKSPNLKKHFEIRF